MKRMHLCRVLVVAAVLGVVAAPAEAGGDPLVVCVAGDGGMRLVASQASCKADEQEKLFAEWEPDAEEPPDDEEAGQTAAAKDLQQLSQRLAALENAQPRSGRPDKTEALNVEALSARVTALEKARHRITAPFEVVSGGGTVILRVAEKTPSEGGQGARVTIGAGASGNYGLRIHKDGGPLVAGIGQSREGSGLVVVMDDAGQLAGHMNGRDKKISVFNGAHAAAGLVADETGGTVAVYNGPTPIAYLTKSSGGDGGNVTVSLNSGFGVFSAGAAQDGAGEACVNRRTQAGTARPACLGLGLPSAGMGK